MYERVLTTEAKTVRGTMSYTLTPASEVRVLLKSPDLLPRQNDVYNAGETDCVDSQLPALSKWSLALNWRRLQTPST